MNKVPAVAAAASATEAARSLPVLVAVATAASFPKLLSPLDFEFVEKAAEIYGQV